MKCDNCKEKCPQEELACEIAKGRLYATDEVIRLQKELEEYRAIGTIEEFKALKKGPSGDLIKRQDAINAVAQLYRYESDRMTALQEVPTFSTQEIRNKTIAEFAERLKERYPLTAKGFGQIINDGIHKDIDEIAEQMKGRCGMIGLNNKHFTNGNSDNLEKAIESLDQFTKNWCMNCKETEEKNDLIFRCGECNFCDEKGGCCIKSFVLDKTDEPTKDFGAMGWH